MHYIKINKLLLMTVLFLTLVFNSVGNNTYAATKVAISHSSLKLEYGSTSSVSMKGTKEKVSWSSSNIKVASVTSSGKLKAKIKAQSEGKATITAKVGKKKYTCKVTVLSPEIYYIGDREVKYYSDSNSHKVFFSMLDKNEQRTYANMKVDIKIINSNNEQVYKKTHNVTKKDYGNWTNLLQGSRYLASIDIPISKLTKGSSKTGKINVTVSGQSASFKEYSLTIDNLPYVTSAEKSSLKLPELPTQLINYTWRGDIDGKLKITNIQYQFEESYDNKVKLTVNFEGERVAAGIDQRISKYLKISYKLYKDGFVIETGTTYTPSLNVGEKFKGEEKVFYSLEPGEYVLELNNTK